MPVSPACEPGAGGGAVLLSPDAMIRAFAKVSAKGLNLMISSSPSTAVCFAMPEVQRALIMPAALRTFRYACPRSSSGN
jgi:hypothetical protein